MSTPDDWLAFARPEADALAAYLAAEGRRTMVFVAATDGETVVLTRGVGGDTTTADARAFITILDRERARLAALVEHTETS